MKKIIVIGATGMLGKPVTKQLINAGFDVTLLVRHHNKAKELFPAAKLANGDVFDKSSLVKAFTSQEIVYLNLSVAQTSKKSQPQPEREGIDNIIAAAKEAGIKRIAYLSSLVHFYNGTNNFNWWAFAIKSSAIEKIKSSGIPYSIFYPSTFMETFPYQMLMGKKIALMGKSQMPMWFIAADDYGQQVAKSFSITENENKEYNIQGLHAYTMDEAGKIFIDNYKKAKLKTMTAPMGVVKFFGNFIQKANYGWHICEALNKYPEKFVSQPTWNELGTPTTLLADYAASL